MLFLLIIFIVTILLISLAFQTFLSSESFSFPEDMEDLDFFPSMGSIEDRELPLSIFLPALFLNFVYLYIELFPLFVLGLSNLQEGCTFFMITLILATIIPLSLFTLCIITRIVLVDNFDLGKHKLMNCYSFDLLSSSYTLFQVLLPICLLVYFLISDSRQCRAKPEQTIFLTLTAISYINLHLLFNVRSASILARREKTTSELVSLFQAQAFLFVPILLAAIISSFQSSKELDLLKYAFITLGSITAKLGYTYNLIFVPIFSAVVPTNRFSRRGLHNCRRFNLDATPEISILGIEFLEGPEIPTDFDIFRPRFYS